MSQYDDLKNYGSAPLAQDAKMALGIQGIYDIYTPPVAGGTGLLPLGTKVRLADGRTFVYAKAGASNIAPHKLNQSEAPSANAQDETLAANLVVGDKQVSITFGGAVTANQYAGGLLYVNDPTAGPGVYTIKSHPAGTTAVIVQIYEKIRKAATAGAGLVSCIKHPLSSLIVAPTTLTSAIQGVALVQIDANSYGWIQTMGTCPVLTNGTLVYTAPVEPSATTAGAVDVSTASTLNANVGVVAQVAASGDYSLIQLDIPGY